MYGAFPRHRSLLILILAWSAVSTVAPHAGAEQANQCFPSCRTGYTCHEQRCISLCNPLCAQGETCTASGECIAGTSSSIPTTAGSGAPLAPQSAAPVPAPAPAPVAAVAPVAAPPADKRELPVPSNAGKLVLGLRIGYALLGGGKSTFCFGKHGSCADPADEGYTDKAPLLIAVDGLYHVTHRLRLGVGYSLIPRSALSYDNNDTKTWSDGSEHALHAIAEALVPVGSSALAFRLFAGPHLLAVNGDLADEGQAYLDHCPDGAHCSWAASPFFGFSYGSMVGVVVGKSFRGRFDLAVERYGFQISEYETTAGDSIWTSTETLHGTRIWLTAGIEL